MSCRSCLYASACSTPRLSHSRAHAAASHALTSLSPPRAFLSALYSVPSQQLPRRFASSRTLAFYYQVLQSARSEFLILLEAGSKLEVLELEKLCEICQHTGLPHWPEGAARKVLREEQPAPSLWKLVELVVTSYTYKQPAMMS